MGPLPNGLFMACKSGDGNHLLKQIQDKWSENAPYKWPKVIMFGRWLFHLTSREQFMPFISEQRKKGPLAV